LAFQFGTLHNTAGEAAGKLPMNDDTAQKCAMANSIEEEWKFELEMVSKYCKPENASQQSVTTIKVNITYIYLLNCNWALARWQ
jgi:hypothetical protein